MVIFDLDELKDKKRKLEHQLNDQNLWSDAENAANLTRELRRIELQIQGYVKLKTEIKDLKELANLQDNSLEKEICDQLSALQKIYKEMELKTLLNAPYDLNDVFLTINAGAGGTDAQDWAEMVLRMYLRWTEKKGFSFETIELSEGDEAGIKSAIINIKGDYAYGILKSEHGIHRLVRLSPFNSNNKRQTSFASVDIIPQIKKDLEIHVAPEELRIDTYRASGAGGQHVNKTDSAVRITHIPTNTVVQCQSSRSQAQNKETAMQVLISKINQIKEQQEAEKRNAVTKANKEISWGNQIRSYVFHPYTMVKDHRTKEEVSQVEEVLNGEIDSFISAYLHFKQE